MISGHDSNFSTGRTTALTTPKTSAIAANTTQASRRTRMPATMNKPLCDECKKL
jgi:hypothetical protein